MRYLLDTDVLIDFFNKKEPSFSHITSLLKNKKEGILSLLTVSEIRAGWSQEQAQTYLPRLYTIFTIEGINRQIVERAGSLRYDYKRQGITLGAVDTLIAATAILNNFCLITRNTKHFLMPELNLYQGLQNSRIGV